MKTNQHSQRQKEPERRSRNMLLSTWKLETCRGTCCPSLWGHPHAWSRTWEAEGERQNELMQLKLQCRPRCCPTQRVDTQIGGPMHELHQHLQHCTEPSECHQSCFLYLPNIGHVSLVANPSPESYRRRDSSSIFPSVYNLFKLSFVCNFLFCPFLY